MSSFSTNPLTANGSEVNVTGAAAELLEKLQATPDKTLPPLIREVAIAGDDGLAALMAWLQARCPEPQASNAAPVNFRELDLVAGAAYQALFTASTPATVAFLQTHFPTGTVPLRSRGAIDYRDLQVLLAKQDFQTADKVTLQKFCELAGPTTVQRKWIYFTEVDQFPIEDLQTIDALWQVHSDGKFGFSVQREIWLSVGKNWEKFWPKIGWKDALNWTRYPDSFTWNLSAPAGHLPLSNQLRGVRVMAALLNHPAWN